MFVTVLSIDKNENKELYDKVVETCKWCATNDKTKNFTFTELPNGGIKISNPQGKDQAFRRGHYFHRKHGVHYEVFWEKA